MFTENELYRACTAVLLYSPLSQDRDDGYYFFGSTDEGIYEVTTYFNFEHRPRFGISEHRALLGDGRYIIYIQTQTSPHEYVTLAYPGDAQEDGFLWENLVKVLSPELDPRSLRMFDSNGQAATDEPWLQKIFDDLRAHVP